MSVSLIKAPPAGSVTTTPGGGAFFDGPEAVNAFRLISLRSALKFEAKTGMKMSRAALLPICKQYGITKGTKKGAYNELNRLMVEAGFDDTGTL